MRSTFAGLNTAVRGLNVQQASLDTMGHNISNVNTEGYSRQTANTTAMPSQTYYGSSSNKNQIGSGATIESITRARDTFYDRQYWKENSVYAFSNGKLTALSNVEQVFQEPTETGVQSVLNKFWESLQTLSTNAADYACRTAVKSCGVNVVNAVQQSAQQLKNCIADANSVIKLKVESVNELTSEIAALNKQIFSVEFNGDHANDLRDRRDLLTDKLSSLADVSVIESADGFYNISLSGNQLVNENVSKNLEVRSHKDTDYGYEVVDIYIKDSDMKVNVDKGEIGALLDTRDNESYGYKGYLNKLSLISQYFLTDFNEVHRAGYGTDDSTGNNFFGNEKATDGTDYDYKNDPENKFAKYTKGDWLNAFATNEVFETTEGLGKIAAKTSLSSDIYVTAKAVTVKTGGKYTGTKAATVTITEDAAKPGTYYANYTDDAGAAQKVEAKLDKGDLTFTINGLTVVANVDNIDPVNYKYVIDTGSTVKVTDHNNNDLSKSQMTVSTVGSYTSAEKSINVQIVKKKGAGGDEYYYKVGDGTEQKATVTGNKFIIDNVGGLTVTIDVNKAAAYGQYVVPISKSNNASGDNAVNMSNFMKSTTVAMLGNTSLETYYASMIADLGIQTQNTDRLTDNQETLVNQIVTWRDSVSGVSVDEEMSNMIRFQRAYGAAARVITTMDEMLDKLINSTGTVGR